MVKSKFKKLIALASSAAMVVSTLVPVAMAEETPQVVQPSETAYITGVAADTPHPGELYANQCKPGDTGFVEGDSLDVSEAALVKFDISQYVGKIRSAEISLRSTCTTSGKNSEVNITSVGTDWNADTVTWNDQTGVGSAVQIAALGFASSNGADFKYDITEAARNDADGILAFGFYTKTARQQQLSNVQLNLVVADEVIPQTKITVRNVLEDGTVLATYEVDNLYVGDSFTAESEMLSDKEYDGFTYTLSGDAVTSIDSITENAVLDILFERLVQDVFVNESFDDLSGTNTWGFSNNSGIVAENGALTLCTMTSDSSASDEKSFAEDAPTLASQKELEVSFKWKTNVDLNAGGGRFSWFSLRDTNGTPILVLVGASNRSALTDVNTQITYGFSETDTKTDFIKIANPNNDFYDVKLNLNFNAKTMTGTITDSSGAVVANLDRTIEAENLGGLRAYHGLSTSSMAIDDFKVLGSRRQSVTFNVTDSSTGSPIEGVAITAGDQTATTDANGVAVMNLIANVTHQATFTKALYRTVTENVVVGEENITFPVAMEKVTDEDFVADVIANMDIANGTTVVKEDSTYKVTGDFELPTPNDANVSWTTDSTDGQVSISANTASVYPKQGKNTTVVLTATVSYGTASDTVSFTLDLADYLDTVTTAVDNAAASEAVYPYDDQNGTYGMDVYAFSKFTAESPLSFDLYLPSTVTGVTDTHISQSWSSNDEAHLAIDAANNKGTIGADDKEAHNVTLTKTVSYMKDGVTLASKAVEYTVPVQFDPEALEDKIGAWATAYAATLSDDTESTVYTNAYNQVYNTFMRQYQLKLDSAYEGNFSNMPDEGTDISTSGISELNYDGFFGSSIEWTSSQSTYASVSKSNKRVTVNRSAFSGTKDITITATIYMPSYAENETRAFKYVITGTKSNGGGGNSSIPGSTGNTGSTTIMPPRPTATPIATKAPASEAFDDIEGVESWAGDSIRALYDKGVVSGKGDKKFAPYDNVTRGEFAKMIVGTFGLNEMPDEYRGFTDVPAGNWCFTYVEVAAAAGVVNGYDDGSFGLDDYITRQDMAVMVVRAAQAAGVTITDNGNSVEFGDTASIADYASAAVESLVKAGIINGIDGNFEPSSNANRAQAAKILANFI